jgi:type VI secretion system protein ImpG
MSADYDDFDDDLLRHYYEKELEILRRDMRAFAERNPEAAARLSINSDGRSDDPGVERLAQSTALLNARHSMKIDDDYPELSGALICQTYPQYLRPFPSCSVAQFDIAGMFDGVAESVRIARGTSLLTKSGKFNFRTAYDVVLAPLRIARARYALTAAVPPSVKLPPEMSGMLSVTFASVKSGGSLDVATPDTLRIHVAGQAQTVAALIDTLQLRTTKAYLEDSAGRWTRLADHPVKRVGFAPQDWLFTDANEPGQPFGLLGEYFAFAQRFHFIDIDFAGLRLAAPGSELTLHLAVERVPPNSQMAQQLAQVNADHLKLFCTPVVNLFAKTDVALKYEAGTRTWPIQAQGRDDSLTEIWSVDQVRTPQGVALSSSSELMTALPSKARPRWTLLQRARPASPDAVRPAALSFASIDGVTQVTGDIGPLWADVTCSNGDLPRSVSIGAVEGDMRVEGKTPGEGKIALLSVPTAVTRLPRTNGALWKLIGQQTTHAFRLTQEGLPALKQIFQQFAVLSPAQARHIDGITALSHKSVMTLMMRKPQPAMVRGIEITLVIDEQLFVANSVAVFAGVMERYFAPYAPSNSFVQLVMKTTGGTVLWRGEPTTGAELPL